MRAEARAVRAAGLHCAQARVWSLSDGDLDAVLGDLDVAARAVAAATAHVIAQVEVRGLPQARGCTSTEVWLRQRLRVSAPAARRLVVLARGLDGRPALDDALSCGAVNVEQARVIADAVADLPADVGGEVVDQAEAALIGFAEQFEPAIVKRLGARILDHVAPQRAEAAEATVLARQEARAFARRGFTLSPVDAGQVRVTGWLDTEAAATVTAALDPLCRPLPGDDRSPAQRRADALTEVCRLASACGGLPDNGGDRPQVVVTIDHDTLVGGASGASGTGGGPGAVGHLDTGGRLSAAQVRRLACDAQVLPAVLGSQGQVLDLGQTRRLLSGAVRRALTLRDGSTNLDNGVLLCGFHHRLIHTSDWTVHLGKDRKPEFIPPAWLDPAQRPRRNPYHRRT